MLFLKVMMLFVVAVVPFWIVGANLLPQSALLDYGGMRGTEQAPAEVPIADKIAWSGDPAAYIGLAIAVVIIASVIWLVCFFASKLIANLSRAIGVFGLVIAAYWLVTIAENYPETEIYLLQAMEDVPATVMIIIFSMMTLAFLYALHVQWTLVLGALNIFRMSEEERAVFKEQALLLGRAQQILFRLLALPVLAPFAGRSRMRFIAIILLAVVSNIIFFWAALGLGSSPRDLAFLVGNVSVSCSVLGRADWVDAIPLLASIPALACFAGQISHLPRLLQLAAQTQVIAILALPLAWLAQRLVRRLVRFSLARLQEVDRRPPVLFLRAFADDQVGLPRGRLALVARILELGRGRPTLDQMLLEEGTPYGPVVALGNPADRNPPYGAARGYFEDKNWQEAVADLAANSKFVVICLDQTEGIFWEIEHLIGNRHLDKTLFLVHPKFASRDANRNYLAGLSELKIPVHELDPVIGFFFKKDGAIRVMQSGTFSRFAYMIAIRTFIQHMGSEPTKP